MDLKALSAEFPRDAVHWRVQGQPYERNGTFSAMALAYIDARDVMDRLDAVCGPDGWQSEITETAGGRVLCRLGIRTESGWVWKTDGAGGTQVEAEKGGISDSLKRAAVSWGIGRYLYRLDSPWVRCEVRQKSGKTFWKGWAEDPWSKVKRTTYNAAAEAQKPPAEEPAPAAAPAPAPQQEKPQRDPAAVRNKMRKFIAGADSYGALQGIEKDPIFKADLAWLHQNAKELAQEIEALCQKRRGELTNGQAPVREGAV